MAGFRSAYTQKGAAPGSLAAVVVGGLIVLAIGFVLGRYAGDVSEPGPVPTAAAEPVSSAVGEPPTTPGGAAGGAAAPPAGRPGGRGAAPPGPLSLQKYNPN